MHFATRTHHQLSWHDLMQQCFSQKKKEKRKLKKLKPPQTKFTCLKPFVQ
jgi:hypothetical protein